MKAPAALRFAALASLTLALSLPGCAHARVQALSNRDVAALSADEVVRVMHTAGFSDEDILKAGTDLRNTLAASGAAQVRLGDKVAAIFAVHGPYLHVSSRMRGSLIYDLRSGEFR